STPKGVRFNADAAERFDGGRGWRDEFSATTLDQTWIMLRAPKETWWKLDGGKLLVNPRAEPLSGRGNPSFLARRVQNAHFTAATALAVPAETGVSAGLVVFQGEKFHYFLAVRREAGGVTAVLERHNRDGLEIVAQQTLGHATQVRLRASAADDKITFAIAADAGGWQTLLDGADAKLLTTEVAGGFVGATVGVHARVDR
ncbi:MAG TPA: glycoside hydrolase family 43 protein, partial [Lacunisphaera sp.]|nr:glycoside hydrolase family 43 protein [Lacunisphaera sp.]